jgi:hypothetical protein
MKNSFRVSWGFLIPIMFITFTLSASAQLSSIGGFEGDMPSYWTKGAEPTGSTLAWATDEFRSMGKSLGSMGIREYGRLLVR